jgi:hypothetical protein
MIFFIIIKYVACVRSFFVQNVKAIYIEIITIMKQLVTTVMNAMNITFKFQNFNLCSIFYFNI